MDSAWSEDTMSVRASRRGWTRVVEWRAHGGWSAVEGLTVMGTKTVAELVVVCVLPPEKVRSLQPPWTLMCSLTGSSDLLVILMPSGIMMDQ